MAHRLRARMATGARHGGHAADEVADPAHAVSGHLGVFAELLGHPGGAAAHAVLPHGQADRLRHRIAGQRV